MFEMIGLLIQTVVLYIVAFAAAFLLAAIFYWLQPKHSRLKRGALTLTAFALPLLTATWWWLCVAFLPQITFFGDIDQPLPNGYCLTALGKMPEYAEVQRCAELQGAATGNAPAMHFLGALAVYAPIVVGEYTPAWVRQHPEDGQGIPPEQQGFPNNFFALNTMTDHLSEYPTEAALEQSLGHPVHLTRTIEFQSSEPDYLQQQRKNTHILFTPPIVALVLLFAFTLYRRLRPTP